MDAEFTSKRLKPRDFRILFLWVRGLPFVEIALRIEHETGRPISPATVANVVRSEAAQEVLARVESNTLDTMMDVQTELQMIAQPVLARKIRIALESSDERLADKSCTELLAMAGNGPVRRVVMEPRDPVHDKYASKTDEQIREGLLAIATKPTEEEVPVGPAPDGTPYN